MKVLTIGRSSDNNNIVINDTKVSRSHLQIVKDDNGNYFAIDLESTNGTFVNGKRISGKIPLQKGDVVVIGNTTLPWETYFVDKSTPTSSDNSVVNKKSNKRKISVIICTLLLISVVLGSVAYVMSYNNKKAEEKMKLDKNYTEALLDAEKEKSNYSDKKRVEAEQNERQAKDAAELAKENEQKAKQNEQKAKEAEALAKENEQKAKDAADLAKQNEKKAKEAEALAKQNEQKAKDAAELAKRNEQKAMCAQMTAEKKVRDAQSAAEEAKETTELTKEFYQLLSKMKKESQIEKVCENLEWKTKTKDKLIDVFNSENTTNERRKEIIKNIKDVLNQSAPSTNTATPAANNLQKPDSTANGNTTTTETNALTVTGN